MRLIINNNFFYILFLLIGQSEYLFSQNEIIKRYKIIYENNFPVDSFLVFESRYDKSRLRQFEKSYLKDGSVVLVKEKLINNQNQLTQENYFYPNENCKIITKYFYRKGKLNS